LITKKSTSSPPSATHPLRNQSQIDVNNTMQENSN